MIFDLARISRGAYWQIALPRAGLFYARIKYKQSDLANILQLEARRAHAGPVVSENTGISFTHSPLGAIYGYFHFDFTAGCFMTLTAVVDFRARRLIRRDSQLCQFPTGAAFTACWRHTHGFFPMITYDAACLFLPPQKVRAFMPKNLA